MVRRAVALGVVVLIVIGLVVGISAWRASAHRSALRTYANDLSALVHESNTRVSRPFFKLLTGARHRPAVTVETQINQYRAAAADEASRARGMSVPGDVANAQRDLVLALDLRAEALGRIASAIRGAVGGSTDPQAPPAIAGQMQALLASDVVYSQRVVPLVRQALSDKGVEGVSLETGRFLPNLGWLNPDVVVARLGGAAGGGGGAGGAIAPGTHGHGLTGVSVGGVALVTGGTVNHIAGSNPVFDVSIQNQGSNDESGITVVVKVSGAGQPITARKTLSQTKAGQTYQVAVPLGQAPPVGTPVTVTATVEPVPGEKVTTNNTQTYTADFTG